MGALITRDDTLVTKALLTTGLGDCQPKGVGKLSYTAGSQQSTSLWDLVEKAY